MVKNKIIFFGTPYFASKILENLLNNKQHIIAIVCQPDVIIKNKTNYHEVKQIAITNNITIIQPNKIDLNFIEQIKSLKPDLIITCSYGKIIPKSVLEIPTYGCVNIHTSLLPKYRGPAPINAVLFNNEKETGCTLMYMNEKMDEGNIIYQQKININDDDNYTTLSEKLISCANNLLDEHIDSLFSNEVKSHIQDHSLATYCKKINREDEKINWNSPASDINGKIRGLAMSPLAYTMYNNQEVKIIKASIINEQNDVGVIKKIDKNGILVGCGNNSLLISEIKVSGKKEISIKQMINGKHMFTIGGKFI